MHYVYFLRSTKNRRCYVGTTDQLPVTRLKQHNQGMNDWSKQNGPFVLLYFETYHCRTDAIKREHFYKSGFGRRIRDLILRAVSAKGGSASG
ncbi:GIY-YIG nuclease family protein [Candidatus Uhrbacteria bacterium]|nr:GIY-YIG nuclease family protein [Candidatus Uhrbacteria bacterium]